MSNAEVLRMMHPFDSGYAVVDRESTRCYVDMMLPALVFM